MKKLMLVALLMFVSTLTAAQSGTYSARLLTPETALKATVAALEDCRKRGYQVAVAVVDRSGIAQAMLRDRFAGPHTVNGDQQGLHRDQFPSRYARACKADPVRHAELGVREIPNVVAVGGGVLIQAAGTTLAAIGVSGAPSGEADDACAKAGIAAIRDEIDF